MKCDAVTAIPSKIVKTVSFIFCAYSETELIGPLYSRIEVNFHPRTLEIVDNTLDEHYQQRHSSREHDIAHRRVAVGPNSHPDRRANHVHECDRHEILPAHCHQLIDSDARQGRTNPHREKNEE